MPLIPPNIPCGKADAILDGLIDLAFSNLSEAVCPRCNAAFGVWQPGESECPECGLVMVVDLTPNTPPNADDTQPRGIVR